MMITNNAGLYIHIPFCVKKCAYCDFLSFPADEDRIYEYIRQLIREIEIRASEFDSGIVDSIYIGGGTPGAVSSEHISNLLSSIGSAFDVSSDAEITIEVNPALVTPQKLETYLNKGVNRISIGVQSFDDSVLKVLGRIHDCRDAIKAIDTARHAGFENINIDLMFGVPGQSIEMVRDSLMKAIELSPEHISLYSLMLEEGTELYNKIFESHELKETDEDEDRLMYEMSVQMVEDAGYIQYEISNAALPGYESRHNLKYWSYAEYAGLGLGASSFLRGERIRNTADIDEYLRSLERGELPVDESNSCRFTEREEQGIFMFTGLRKSQGIDESQFRELFGLDIFDIYDPGILDRYRGLLKYEDGRLFLTKQGFNVSNRIMAEFV